MRIRRTNPRTPGPKDGVVLIWTVFAAIVILGSSFVTGSLAKTANIRAKTAVARGTAEASSHAAVEAATEAIRASLKRGATPPATGSFTVGGETVTYSIQQDTAPVSLQDSGGLHQMGSVYRVVGMGQSGSVARTMRRMTRAALIPIFQFSIFYENDLEFYNPQTWNIRGRVHCNSDIYLRAQRNVTFDTNYVHTAGSLYGRAPFGTWNSLAGVAPSIRRWVPDPFDTSAAVDMETLPIIEDLAGLGLTTTGGIDTDFAGSDLNGDGDFDDPGELAPFLGATLDLFGAYGGPAGGETTLQTAENGVVPLAPPTPDEMAPFVAATGGDYTYDSTSDTYTQVAAGTGTHALGGYHADAGLVIHTRPDGSWTATDADGFDVTTAIQSAVTSSTIYDSRQAGATTGQLQQLELDLGALVAAGAFPANGLIYMSGAGAGTGTDAKAFTLKNGAELPAGLTVVSPNSLYIQGDYNVVDPKPASAIGDAVNLLSNSWDGSKGPGDLPPATETTYHLSVIAGDVESTETVLSGGPHNLPRRHENWNGVDEHLIGSIVCPFRSQYATGDFQLGGDYYLPPNRFWEFDDRNNDLTQLPPFTPVTVEVEAMVTWIPRP